MRARAASVLITGAGGEMGHGLIERLAAPGRGGERSVATLDLNPLAPRLAGLVRKEYAGSILDTQLLERIQSEAEVDEVYHLAALLSTRSEFSPALAHKVNVEGTLNLLEFAQRAGESHGRAVKFFYPSSIAVYGLPDLATKAGAGKVREGEYLFPATMYGANKLYCEHLGRYYAAHYRQLAAGPVGGAAGRVDFRAIRFPGIISAETLPSGGTSDYAPEMLHAAASGQAYACFVRPDTRIPLMTMPDAVDAILKLMRAPRADLTQPVYQVSAFAPACAEIAAVVRAAFPGATVTTAVDEKRQAILDRWPADVEDSAARRDWGHAPRHGFESAFAEYLVPAVRRRYGG